MNILFLINGQIAIKIEFTKGREWVQSGAMYVGQVGEMNKKPDNHFGKKTFIQKAKLHSSHTTPYHRCRCCCSDGCHLSLFLPTFSSPACPKLLQVLCIRFGCPLSPRAPFLPHLTHLAVGGHVWYCVCVCKRPWVSEPHIYRQDGSLRECWKNLIFLLDVVGGDQASVPFQFGNIVVNLLSCVHHEVDKHQKG